MFTESKAPPIRAPAKLAGHQQLLPRTAGKIVISRVRVKVLYAGWAGECPSWVH